MSGMMFHSLARRHPGGAVWVCAAARTAFGAVRWPLHIGHAATCHPFNRLLDSTVLGRTAITSASSTSHSSATLP